MAKRMMRSSGRRKRLPPLQGIGRAVVDYVMNSVALGGYPSCCTVDAIAKAMQRDPSRFRPTINKLVELGFLSMNETDEEIILPTIAALMHQDNDLSEAEAKRVLARLKRRR
ncbi:MAG TPA: hypothetical protein VG713_08450 [Pirellulales bacterium]|nr:hypothetical protein [Pirellulales bacterium]